MVAENSEGARLSVFQHLLAGTQLDGRYGHYLPTAELRRGGMGVIYLADVVAATGDQAQVVIKMSLRADDHARGRMAQEIAALRALEHSQVVSVIDEGSIDGHAWYAMDYVGACNLGDLLLVSGPAAPGDLPGLITGIVEGHLPALPREQRTGLPLGSVVALLIQVAETVAHAHQRGVLHRDLKPANILLSESGEPVLCDFGVARARDFHLHLTAVDEVVGTVEYIAPEQYRGQAPDERADCYAMGAMLYECLCGQLPPRRQQAWQPLPGLRGIPPALAAIVAHALHPDPRRRVRSAQALAADLRRFQQGLPVRAPRARWGSRLFWALYRRPMSSGFIFAVLVLGGLLWWAADQQRRRQGLTWQQPMVHLAAADLRPSAFTDMAGPWVSAPHGQAGMSVGFPRSQLPDEEHGHVHIGRYLPPRSGYRVSVEVDTRAATQEISLYMDGGAGEEWQSGYVMQLGAYDNSCSILRRGPTILWMGPQTVVPQQRLRLSLERRGDLLRVTLNDQELVAVHDLLPRSGGHAGLASYVYNDRDYPDPPVYRRYQVQDVELPPLVEADWLVASHARNIESTRGKTRASVVRSGVIMAQALDRRLDRGDPRRGLLQLRSARLQRLHEGAEAITGTPELSSFAEALASYAEYHLELLRLEQDHPQRVRHLLRQALASLSEDEQVRLVFAIEQELPYAVWQPQAEQLLAVFIDRQKSVAYDYLAWRILYNALFNSNKPDTVTAELPVYLLTYLRQQEPANVWTRQATQLWRRHGWWLSLYTSEPLFAADDGWLTPIQRELWLALLQGKSWSQLRDAVADVVSPAVELAYQWHNDSTPVNAADGAQHYADEKWWHFAWLAEPETAGGATSSLARQEQLLRHQAVAFLFAPDPGRFVGAHPPHQGQQSVALLEVVMAGMIRGFFPAEEMALVIAAEHPWQPLWRWVLNPQADQPPPPPPANEAALAPLLRLALAQAAQQRGFADYAETQLSLLQQGPPQLPVTQAARAIARWGWP